MIRASAVATLLLLASATWAGDSRDEQARVLYAAGKADFQAEQFQAAYDRFKQAYLLSKAPELLYNMASALEQAGRPHDGAEELKAYLRARPNDDEKSEIESRIRALEEAQRLLDTDKLKNAPPKLLVLPPPAPKWNRKKSIITAVSVVVGVGLAVGLGVGLGLGLKQEYTATLLGTHKGTP